MNVISITNKGCRRTGEGAGRLATDETGKKRVVIGFFKEKLATTPQEPPASLSTPSIASLGTVQAPPLVEAPPEQQEPTVQRPVSMTSTPIQAAQPFSPTQPHGLTKPTSPTIRSQPSSPPHSHPSSQSELNKSTEVDSDYNQNGADYALNVAPNEEQTSISATSIIPNNPQTKSVISHPDDKIPVPKSPENRNLDEPQPLKYEESPQNQILNEKPSIITLAGDNRGTSMQIVAGETKQEQSIHIHRRYKVNPDDSMTDEEEKEEDSKANENEENCYINCNIQGINNSMVFDCSITERSPGVHIGSCDQDNVKKLKRKYIKSTDLNKVKVSSSPSKKHVIRRRCLRGLFMESSESDPNDPQKPRRHGCRYIGGEDKRNNDDKMDV
ncbi:hypothetical protein E3N88_10459 [Mikania micrantha]|uniref:Uncharacterized protein n=1 Tax=Mikania micrantha TaxID=192012 RepID=A0A5N6PBP3_9ASTR|nr:hypothetical protein E3N88_10459 [Mikania micrantha]